MTNAVEVMVAFGSAVTCRRVLATPLYGPPILVQADTALIDLLSS
ncbi:hypothetical protein AB0283_15740 [Micromonospora vinacea]